MRTRPAADEFAAYYGKYISLVPGDDALESLRHQVHGTTEMLHGLAEAQGNHRYEPEKWSIKEVIGHVIDAERVFAYRAMRIARADETPLAAFTENDYVANGGFGARSITDLTDEFDLVRRANVAMFAGLPDEAWLRRGTASEHPVSVRALAYIIAGHELHHVNLLQTRYL